MIYNYVKRIITLPLEGIKTMKIRLLTLLTAATLVLLSPMINAFKVLVGNKEELDVPEYAAPYMKTIQNMLQDLPSTPTAPIPLPNIEPKIFQDILKIIKNIKGIKDSDADKLHAKKISKTGEYLRDNIKKHKTLVKLATTANYLDFEILLDASILELKERFKIDTINSQIQVYRIETLIKEAPNDITNRLLATPLERVMEEITICRLSDLKNLKSVTGKIQGEDEINSVSWNPKDESLASGSRNGIVAIRSIKYSRTTKEIQENGEVNSVSWDPTGKHIVYSYYDTTTQRWNIKIWDVKKNKTKVIKTLEEGNKATAVSYSPDGKHIAFGFYNKPDDLLIGNIAAQPGIIEIWNIKNKKFTKRLQGHTKSIHAIAWHPNSQHLASGSYDKTIRIWDVTTGKTISTFLMGRLGVVALAWSPFGRYIFSSSLPQGITILDVKNEKSIISHRDEGKWVKSAYWGPASISVFSAFGYRSNKNKSGEIKRWQLFDDNTTSKMLNNMITKDNRGILKINISSEQALEFIAAWNAHQANKKFKFESITDPKLINLVKKCQQV